MNDNFLKVLVVGALFTIVGLGNVVKADVIDSNDIVVANAGNYWPWGDANNSGYQLWFSDSLLGSNSGFVDSITHYAKGPFGAGGTYNLDVYLSTTNKDFSSLETNYANNHGSNKTLVFSGDLTLASSELLIDIDNIFNYQSGNLLIEYDFNSFTGVSPGYNGQEFQSVGYNNQMLRVTQNSDEGSKVLDFGALRTTLAFNAVAVPEPSTFAIFALGLFGMLISRVKRT